VCKIIYAALYCNVHVLDSFISISAYSICSVNSCFVAAVNGYKIPCGIANRREGVPKMCDLQICVDINVSIFVYSL
jgi:hypothetical protein